MDSTFTPADKMGVFLQVYNLKVDDKTHKADASVEYRVMKDKETDPLLKFTVTSDKMPQHGEELTLPYAITLGSLPPGKYTLEVAITDNLAKQTITPNYQFHSEGLTCECRSGEVKRSDASSQSSSLLPGALCVRLCLALPLAAAPNSGKISGVVVDPGGTPQMGATVHVSSDQLASFSSIELLTNDHGRFSTATLPVGFYSIKVTLAGFLPAIEQHIQGNKSARNSAGSGDGIGIFFD